MTPQDLLGHNCLRFNFRRAAPDWPFRVEGREFSLKVAGTIEGNSGEALAQLAKLGAGVARIGAFSVVEEVRRGELVVLLEEFNPGDVEPIHAVFVGEGRCRRGLGRLWIFWWGGVGVEGRGFWGGGG